MLSGFVIAHAHERQLVAGMTRWQFALRRRVRIWPLLLIALGLSTAVNLLPAPLGVPQFLGRAASVASSQLNILLLPMPQSLSLLPSEAFLLIGPAWSMSVEAAANLAHVATLTTLAAHRLTFALLMRKQVAT